jgi:hypothetical protein
MSRLIQTMIEHLVAHPPETAAAFLNSMKIGEALSQHWITGTGAILALTKIGQSDRRRRQAGTGDDHAVSRKLPA